MRWKLPENSGEYRKIQSELYEPGQIVVGDFSLLPDDEEASAVSYSFGWQNGATPEFNMIEGVLFKVIYVRNAGIGLEVIDSQDHGLEEIEMQHIERLSFPFYLLRHVMLDVEHDVIPECDHTVREGKYSGILYHTVGEDDEYYYVREITTDDQPFYEPTFFKCEKDMLSEPLTDSITFRIIDGQLTLDRKDTDDEKTTSD